MEKSNFSEFDSSNCEFSWLVKIFLNQSINDSPIGFPRDQSINYRSAIISSSHGRRRFPPVVINAGPIANGNDFFFFFALPVTVWMRFLFILHVGNVTIVNRRSNALFVWLSNDFPCPTALNHAVEP